MLLSSDRVQHFRTKSFKSKVFPDVVDADSTPYASGEESLWKFSARQEDSVCEAVETSLNMQHH